MKHLKSFNESINKDDMQEYCEMNLAYLMDEGLQVSVSQNYMFRQLITKVELSFTRNTTWRQIKDHIIPFLHRLNNTYVLDPTQNYLKNTDRFFEVQMPNGRHAYSNYYMSYNTLEELTNNKIIQKIRFNLK